MDNKILEYKRILNLNVYAIGRKTDDFSGLLRREYPGCLYQQCFGRSADRVGARDGQPTGPAIVSAARSADFEFGYRARTQ